MRKYSLFTWLFTVTIMFSLLSVSYADTIGPGGSTTSFTAFTPASFSGAALATTNGAFSLANATTGTQATGTYESAVYTDATTGGLDFLYQLSSNASSNDALTGLSMGSFAGWTTNVGYFNGPFGIFTSGSAGIVPSSSLVTPSGQTVDFNFSGSISGGQTTSILVVATNATSLTSGALNIKDNGVATVTTFAPAPESGSMLLFGTGLSGLAMMLRRSTKSGKALKILRN